jgi:oligoribonuclease NrnB/cAMP/cGMP phosphodiesterase (DHH superfamily)
MGVLVCFHDRCFDGLGSAAVFTRFYLQCIDPQAEFRYHGLVHRAGQLFDEGLFDDQENVIVDFKYSSSERLTWWFDHHQSAFLTEADAEHFRHDRSGKKFYGPDYRSCTKFIVETCRAKFGFVAPELDKPLQEIMDIPEVRQTFDRLYALHLKTTDTIRSRGELKNGVLFFDVADQNFEGFNKFIPYYLFPEAVYSVALSRSRARIKIGVGSNPWNATPKTANLASICERYGGGGHAKVAAISLPPTDFALARKVADEILSDLRSGLAPPIGNRGQGTGNRE